MARPPAGANGETAGSGLGIHSVAPNSRRRYAAARQRSCKKIGCVCGLSIVFAIDRKSALSNGFRVRRAILEIAPPWHFLSIIMDLMPAMTNFAIARRNMVDSQLRTSKVTDERLVAAMAAIRREEFVPASRRPVAYVDEALPVAPGRYLPAPLVAARLYQMATPTPDDLVLLVGAGTGYGAAVLGRLVSAVVALECDNELAAMAEQALAAAEIDNVIVAEGPLEEGWEKQAPYDIIAFEGAIAEVPEAILSQLAPNGRIVAAMIGANDIPVATILWKTPTSVAAESVFDANIPTLPGFERVREFEF